MKMVFVSNYINHHQLPLARELYRMLEGTYAFIQLEKMDEERIELGWGGIENQFPFLFYYPQDTRRCQELIDNADIVVLGSETNPPCIMNRLQRNAPVLRYSERIYKEGQYKVMSPRGLIKKFEDHVKYRKKPVYLLCAGGYVGSDYALIHAYPNKKFTWGYFPESKEYDVDELLRSKKKDIVHILWAGRMIDWKHPEYPVKLAKELRNRKIPFLLEMIGGGVLLGELKKMVHDLDLDDIVSFSGTMRPEQVRGKMEAADIYLFTSNYQEGWGAVLNEAMNSGCAVVANHAIGAVPSLVKDGVNGLIYQDGKFEEFLKHVLTLCESYEVRSEFGRNAYQTIHQEWNEKKAASRLVELCTGIINNDYMYSQSGILSKALEIGPKSMYRHLKNKEK